VIGEEKGMIGTEMGEDERGIDKRDKEHEGRERAERGARTD
jgi:hypothetical protein